MEEENVEREESSRGGEWKGKEAHSLQIYSEF